VLPLNIQEKETLCRTPTQIIQTIGWMLIIDDYLAQDILTILETKPTRCTNFLNLFLE
jgi:hypothetical protein